MAQRITLTVNGTPQPIEVDDPHMPLLYALRDDLGLNFMQYCISRAPRSNTSPQSTANQAECRERPA